MSRPSPGTPRGGSAVARCIGLGIALIAAELALALRLARQEVVTARCIRVLLRLQRLVPRIPVPLRAVVAHGADLGLGREKIEESS